MGVIKQDSVILDLACGNGRMCKEFYKDVKYIVGTDICDTFLNYLNIWKVDNHIDNVDLKKIDLLDNNFSTFFKMSDELKERYIAKYRTVSSIKKISQKAGFNNILSQNAYNKEDLGDKYYEIERWSKTKQKFILIKNQF